MAFFNEYRGLDKDDPTGKSDVRDRPDPAGSDYRPGHFRPVAGLAPAPALHPAPAFVWLDRRPGYRPAAHRCDLRRPGFPNRLPFGSPHSLRGGALSTAFRASRGRANGAQPDHPGRAGRVGRRGRVCLPAIGSQPQAGRPAGSHHDRQRPDGHPALAAVRTAHTPPVQHPQMGEHRYRPGRGDHRSTGLRGDRLGELRHGCRRDAGAGRAGHPGRRGAGRAVLRRADDPLDAPLPAAGVLAEPGCPGAGHHRLHSF